MKRVFVVLCLLCISVFATDKPTSIEDAKAAVKANTSTPEGIAFDGKIGKEFGNKYSQTVFRCVQTAGDDLESFTFYFRLTKDGTVAELIEDHKTKVSECVRRELSKGKFSAPPRPDYWLDIQMTLKQ